MNIALFSDSYLPTKSGIVTVVVQLREQLIKAGHNVVLVTVQTTPEFATDDPDIYRTKSVPLGLGTDQFLSIPKMKPLIKFLKEKKIDIIHCHTEFGLGKAGLKAARKLGIPAICTTHTMWVLFYKHYLPCGKLIPPGIINAILNHYYKQFDSLIGVSTKARNFFKQPKMLPNQPSAIVPNAIDRSKFQATHITAQERHELRAKYGFADDDKIMLFVGRVGEEKRVFELLEVCKKVCAANPKYKMIFVGNGPAFEEMQNRAAENIANGSIVFAGFIEWVKVHAFYESCDLFVTTSLSEMHSMTILEAQLSGLPIVVRNDESYADCVFDGVNGYVTQSEDEMSEKIILLLGDDKKLKEFGQAGLETTKKFTIETHVNKTVEVYNQVLKAYPNKINDEEVNKILKEKF